jgi:uncharacterized protein YecE (DUF72 family)
MLLPYYLGCPSWSENAWREYLYPADARSSDYLALYSQVFNAVEGNTTFYARPSVATVQRWAEIMPEHFRFTAKFPGDISHSGNLIEQLPAAESFLGLMSPLGERISPLWLQLPASFTPQRLGELAGFIDGLERPLAVEVRHSEFFAKGDAERSLNACCVIVAWNASAWTRGRCSVARPHRPPCCTPNRKSPRCQLVRRR